MRKTTFTALILKGFLLFSIFTVVQELPLFNNINKIWLVIMAVAILFKMFQYKYTGKELTVLILTAMIHLVALNFTEFPLVNINVLFYFLLWVVLYMFFVKSKNKILEVLEQSSNYVDAILWLWTLLVGVSVFLPSSYNGRYFVSFTSSSFRFMPTTLIIMALAMFQAINTRNTQYYWFLVLPTYAGLMNQSRTYFVVYFGFLAIFIYVQMKNKKLFYTLMIPFACMILLLASVSGISDKLASVQYTDSSYFDFWGTITSGRTIFWEMDVKAFFALPFWKQFVGNGFNFVYEVNANGFAEIWAHNDIINILMNFGYIGTAIYMWIFFKMTRAYFDSVTYVPKLVRLLFYFTVFFNSMMNMSYTYLCATISYPLILCAISEKYTFKEMSAK